MNPDCWKTALGRLCEFTIQPWPTVHGLLRHFAIMVKTTVLASYDDGLSVQEHWNTQTISDYIFSYLSGPNFDHFI